MTDGPFARLGVDREHVPVDGPTGGGGHREECVDLGVGEAVVATLDDGFESGARMLAHRSAQLDDLAVGADARCDRTILGVGVRWRARGRKAETTGFDRSFELDHHLGELVGCRGTLECRVAHHVMADRTMADQEARVDT